MRKKLIKKSVTTQDSYAVSISDLMSSLLAIFILLLSYFILNFNQAAAQLTQNDVKRAQLLERIYTTLEHEGIKVIIDEQHGILRISEGVLFDVGMAEIKPQGKVVIQKLSSVLNKTLVEEEFKGTVETIFVEGHTDDVPISNGIFPSNWELSTKRAINTWLEMGATAPELPKLLNKNQQPIFSCSGYADTRPIADNKTEAGRGENRRIDIRFSMMAPSEEDMKVVKFIRERLNK